MIAVRRAGPADADPVARLLNEIIEAGGTTAMTRPVTGGDIAEWMRSDPRAIWHIAEDADGTLLGLQWIEPSPEPGPETAEIATFTRRGRTGEGIGSALFAKTSDAAREAGFLRIHAEIRADNAGGLAYYQSRGFETVGRRTGVRLESGAVVDKVSKMFDLT